MLLPEAFAGTIPIQGTEIAARWDHLYIFLLWLSAFFFVLVVGAMLFFTFKYKHKPGVKTKYIAGHHLLEALWIGIPTFLLLIIFGWGYSVYHAMIQAPSDAYEVRVIGKQWFWTFQYEDGRTTVNELYVPIHQPVKLIMTSEDVLHSFFIPNFRIKQDVVPGIYSSIWFTATVPGKHQVFCAEYCGTSHSTMLAKVIALDPDQWSRWSRGQKLADIPEAGTETATAIPVPDEHALPDSQAMKKAKVGSAAKAAESRVAVPKVRFALIEQGQALYQNKGCVACHSVDGSPKIGPSHKGLFGRKTELADGRFVVADENYIRGHIENPNSGVVKGYSPMMPTFKGLISETEMNALIAYLKSLK